MKKFSTDVDHGVVLDLLIESGMPKEVKDSVNFGPNGIVTIRGLGSDICSHLIEKLHGTRFSGKKIYCNGIIPTTPEKVQDKKIAPTKDVTRTVSSGASESETSDQLNSHTTPIKEVDIPQVLSPPSSVMWLLLEPGDLARRHSLSLLNRTPPPGSLSAEFFGIPGPSTRKASTNQVTLAAVKDIIESLSDFNSCSSY